MATATLADLASVFHRRFLFNALLPTLVFTSLTAIVVVDRSAGLGRCSAWWTDLDGVSKALVVLAYAGVVWFLAAAVQSQWRAVVRLFEGYPAMALRRFLRRKLPGVNWAIPGVAWHHARMEHIDAHRLYRGYAEDHEEALLPTRLGNVLFASERYPADRYGIDPIYFWPRLYPLLPERFQVDLEEFLIEHEFPLVVAFEAALAATITGIAVLLSEGPPLMFIVCFGGGFIVAFAFYRLSIESAEEFGEQLRTAFDLYRDRLLEQWPTVADVRNEKDAFRQIQDFVVYGASPNWQSEQEAHQARRKV